MNRWRNFDQLEDVNVVSAGMFGLVATCKPKFVFSDPDVGSEKKNIENEHKGTGRTGTNSKHNHSRHHHTTKDEPRVAVEVVYSFGGRGGLAVKDGEHNFKVGWVAMQVFERIQYKHLSSFCSLLSLDQLISRNPTSSSCADCAMVCVVVLYVGFLSDHRFHQVLAGLPHHPNVIVVLGNLGLMQVTDRLARLMPPAVQQRCKVRNCCV